MLGLSNNPILKIGAGGVTITGTITDPGIQLKWWFIEDPTSKFDLGFEYNGLNWSLDFQYVSAFDQIYVQGFKGTAYTTQLYFDLSTKSREPEIDLIWNEFDEFALEANLARVPMENNESLRRRTLDVYSNPGNSTREGLTLAIERELLLPHLDPFFFIGARLNPVTDEPFINGRVNFKHFAVTVQLDSFVVHNEVVNVDVVRGTFKTVKLIGSEYENEERFIRIFNGSLEVSRRAWKQVDENEIFIDPQFKGLDFSKPLYITYPYIEKFDYIQNGETKTVSDVRSFIRSLSTVIDEHSIERSGIVWNDGYLEPINFIPEVFEVRESLPQALVTPPTQEYVKISTSMVDEYYRYVQPFLAKGFFPATSILPTSEFRLSKFLRKVRGTWIRLDALSDPEYRASIAIGGKISSSDRNLQSIARILQEATRMGMARTIVNRDRWGSDSPAIIGPNFLPSRFDGGLQKFSIMTSDGSFEEIDLNKRKYLAKVVEHQRK